MRPGRSGCTAFASSPAESGLIWRLRACPGSSPSPPLLSPGSPNLCSCSCPCFLLFLSCPCLRTRWHSSSLLFLCLCLDCPSHSSWRCPCLAPSPLAWRAFLRIALGWMWPPSSSGKSSMCLAVGQFWSRRL